jgi:hypothetical protein
MIDIPYLKTILIAVSVMTLLQTGLVFKLFTDIRVLEKNGYFDIEGAKAQGGGGGGMVGKC